MAVDRMRKVSIITFRNLREDLLKELQKLGNVHFKELDAKNLPEEYLFMEKECQLEESGFIEHKAIVESTLKALKPFYPKKKLTQKRPILTYEECCDYLYNEGILEIHKKVKEIANRNDEFTQEISRIKTENAQLNPYTFLEFAPSDLKSFQEVTGVLLSMRSENIQWKEKLEEAFEEVYLELLGKIKQEDIYLLMVDKKRWGELESYLYENGITIVDLSLDLIPAKRISANLRRLEEIEKLREECKDQLRVLSTEYDKILIEQDALQIVMARNKVKDYFLRSESVLYMEGWVPQEEEEALREVLSAACHEDYFMESEEVAEDETEVPIKLKNAGFFKPFESITAMYSLPKYNEIDPTSIMAVFYFIFFGMMVGDTGYGLVLALGCLGILKFIDLNEKMRNSIKLFFYLGISVILCGFIYGSFFGITFFAPIPVEGGGFKPILDTQSDIVIMLVLSLVIGVIHIFTGLIMKGMNCYKQKDFFGIFSDSILWMLTLASGILLLLTGAGIIKGMNPKIFGFIFAACLVGLAATQGRESKSIGGKIGGGLYGVYGLTSYIGDIVSYTRIVALGLSGAYIAFSFNLMSGLIPGTIGRLIFGGLIAVFGQVLNFGLSLLGAYVHSSRLQYVEFFGKFFDGGGKVYRPFATESDNVSIKK
jgi:V/A-type H+-transporting ATPase subunit I